MNEEADARDIEVQLDADEESEEEEIKDDLDNYGNEEEYDE